MKSTKEEARSLASEIIAELQGKGSELSRSAKMYTKEDVKRIFDENKILMGNRDAVPVYVAKEIFGEEAVEFSHRMEMFNGYGIGDYTLYGLNLPQFETAATYCNVSKAKDIEVVQHEV